MEDLRDRLNLFQNPVGLGFVDSNLCINLRLDFTGDEVFRSNDNDESDNLGDLNVSTEY